MKQKYNLLKAFKDSWAGPEPLTWHVKLCLHSCQYYCVNVYCILFLGDRLLRVGNRRMRRSGAPSQLLGNAMKKPRFMPPGACTAAESKPLTPKFGLVNALQKVHFFLQHFICSFISDALIWFWSSSLVSIFLISFSLPFILQVQRSLAAPVQSKTDDEVQPKAAQAAPGLSRVLARVLNATDSKENEAETEHPCTDLVDNTKDNTPAGKTQRSCVSSMGKNGGKGLVTKRVSFFKS